MPNALLAESPNADAVARHRTAIARNALSRPIAMAIADGLLPRDSTLFDYGCGRGDDLRLLIDLGYRVAGWDPAHRPNTPPQPADVVSLGYVVNVIEDPRERVEALRAAWSLARVLLVVAARMDWEGQRLPGRSYGDGIVTRRGTFQKFFGQDELRAWIDGVLGVRSFAAAPGIFYIFRDDRRAQSFLAERVRRPPIVVAREPGIRRARQSVFEAHRSLLEPLVSFLTARGRLPDPTEFGDAALPIVDRFGSIRAAAAVVRRATGDEAWRTAQVVATDDLLVYLALAAFGGRPKLGALPADIQLDIRAFLGTYKFACEKADALLFGAGDQMAIARACRTMSVGKLTPNALYVHVSALPHLNPLLRVYEGCARTLTGTVSEANLVKLHRTEAKVSYLAYPAFDHDPHPTLHQSVRADLRRLDVRIRDFRGRVNPPILHRKETFVALDYPRRSMFARLTEQEESAGLLADPSTIGGRSQWTALLTAKGLGFRGHRLVKSRAAAV